MPNHSIDGYEKQARTFSEWVWYEGTGEGGGTALVEGQAVCYNWDYGTATAADGRRYNRVQNPTTANAQHFAGVAARDYSALGTSARLIEIFGPGSVCNVLCGKDTNTVVGQGLLTFDVTATFLGQFRFEGLPGAGSVQPLQTTTGDASDPGPCLAYLQEGSQSGGIEVVALAGGSAFVAMVGGTTQGTGYAAATDATETILDGLIPGMRKKLVVKTTAISGGGAMVVTIDNNDGITLAGGALATLTFTNAAIGAGSTIVWKDGAWHHVDGAGFVEA